MAQQVFARAPKTVPSSSSRYITADKSYPVVGKDDGSYFTIIDDVGDEIGCLWEGCAHLCGDDWTRVEDGQ